MLIFLMVLGDQLGETTSAYGAIKNTLGIMTDHKEIKRRSDNENKKPTT